MPAKHDVDLKVGVTGAEQFKRDTEKAGEATSKMGKKVGETGTKAKDTTKEIGLLGRTVNSLKQSLLGLVGITALFAFFKKWLDAIKEIDAAQRLLVNSTKELDTASKALATQAGVIGKPGGIEAAQRQIVDITRGAGLQSFAQAQSVAAAAHSAFGTRGQLFNQQQLQIAIAVGQLSQVQEGVGQKSLEELSKIAIASGATTVPQIQASLQQASVIQQASIISAPDPFFAGAGKAITGLVGLGVEPAVATGMFAGIIGGGGTAELAADTLRQLTAISLEIPSIRHLPTQQRLLAFMQLARGKTDVQLQALGLSGERAVKVAPAFSEINVDRKSVV